MNNIGKAAGPIGVESEMMKASGGFGTRWMTDLINNISKKAVYQTIGEIVSWCLCTRGGGKGDPLVCGSYRAIKLLDQPMKVMSVGKDQMSGVN